jgi:hypothetical protein
LIIFNYNNKQIIILNLEIMAKGNGRQLEKQERTMAEFSKIAKLTSKPGYKQNRLVDKLIEEGAIRRAESENKVKEEKPRFTGRDAYAFVYGGQK